MKRMPWFFLLLLSPSIFAFSLNEIKLPPGFHISIYADNVINARQLALGKNGVVFVGTREKRVYALIPNHNLTKAKQVVVIASNLKAPNGVAFYQDDLYVGDIQRILRYPNILKNIKHPPKPQVILNSLPKKTHHGFRYIKFGPDGKLYISIGMPCNICNYRNTQPLFGTIVRVQPDGKNLQIYAKGIRNSVGFAWQPVTNVLWFTDNGQDWMGPNLPPDELNRAPRAGMDFGFPFFYGNNIPTLSYKDANISSKGMTPPAFEFQAHVAVLGMTFYTGQQFPPHYHNQIFIAEHGSWNRLIKVGYQVIMVTVKGDKAIKATPFASGWLERQRPYGRPVDVLVMPDGALLVSDDYADKIYRISYK